MTDDQVKEAVERLTLCAKWCDTKDMTIKGQKERAAFAADIRAMLTRNDALQAERDKLAAEVERLTAECALGDMRASYDDLMEQHRSSLVEVASLRANLTALVEALDLCLTGGNHIAGLLIDQAGPGFSERLPPGTDHEIALRTLHATDAYELWCCWNAIMRARDIRDAAQSAPPTTPTSAPVEDVGGLERDTTKLDATALTDAELIVEQTRVEKLWDSMFEPDENGEVFEGHGGSPGEWMQERMMEIAQEQQRRGDLSPSLIQPETIPAADDNHKALVEACKPFSALADYFDGAHQPMPDSVHLNHGMTLGDCRRVRQAMAAFTKETDHGGE